MADVQVGKRENLADLSPHILDLERRVADLEMQFAILIGAVNGLAQSLQKLLEPHA